MLYSGADLIRTSGQQLERGEKLKVVPKEVEPAASPQQPQLTLDEETQNALLRFARFIHKESKEKEQKNRPRVSKFQPITHPYLRAQENLKRLDDSGQVLDIYA